jgi:uncharacterized Zn finger protein
MLPILRLNCISCGHFINLHEDVYADYEGLIKCDACGGILNIKIQEGKLKSMAFERIAKPAPPYHGGEESFVARPA